MTLYACGLVGDRLVRKKIDCTKDGLANGKDDRLYLHVCMMHVHVIVYDGRR